jgi:hypothetical protein
LGDADVITTGFEIFDREVLSRANETGNPFNNVDGNLLSPLIQASFATLNANVFNSIISYVTGSVINDDQKRLIISSLGAVYLNSTLLQQAVDFVLSDSVRTNLKTTGLAATRRCNGRFTMWDTLQRNNSFEWNKLATTFISGFSMTALTNLPSSFASQTQYMNVSTFFAAGHVTSGNEPAANQTIESVLQRSNWLVANRAGVRGFLEAEGYYTVSHKKNKEQWYEAAWFIVIMSVLGVLTLAGLVWFVYKRMGTTRMKGDLAAYQKHVDTEQPPAGYGATATATTSTS